MGRLTFHYITAYILISLYGGQVCPYVESLTLSRWASEAALIFITTYTLNVFVYYKLSSGEVIKDSRLLIASTFTIFFSGGLIATVYNMIHHTFPFASGMKLKLGWATLGFFITLDIAMQNRKKMIKYLAKTGQHLEIEQSYASLTKKFLFFSILTTIFVMGTTFLVILKDLDWLLSFSDGTMNAAIPVLKEFAFIFAVIVGYAIVIVLSFTDVLKLYLKYQNKALTEVINGNLTVSVPVSSQDEFGHMAQYTNIMIQSLKERTEALQITQDVSILSLASLAETRDNETGAHIMRTQRYVKELALRLSEHENYSDELTNDNIELIYKSAPLHDMGKVGIPDNILLKPGKLTEEEFKIMKRHPYLGKKSLQSAAGVLGRNSFLKYAEEIAYTHHEKWDGSGYPRGLKGEEIPVSGRIMAVADVYDALISKRVYKDAFSHEKAKEIILEGSGTHFDPKVVQAFLECEENFISIASKYSDQNYKNETNKKPDEKKEA